MRLFVLLLFLSGCVQVLGIEDWGASGTTGSSSDSSSGASGGASPTSTTVTGPAACGSDGNALCLPIPVGWKGPVTLTTQGGTACTGTFDQEIASGETDLVGQDAVCSCDCTGPAGGSCGPAHLNWFLDGACTAPGGTIDLNNGTCAGSLTGNPSNALGFSMSNPTLTPSSCVAVPGKTVPAATFDVRHVCGIQTVPAACGTMQSCVPKPDADKDARLCVWSEGANACPTAELGYSVTVFRKPHLDDRSCSVCKCDVSGEGCTASGSVHGPNTTCTSTMPKVSTGACTALAGAGLGSAIAAITHAKGSCSPNAPSVATGSVTGQDPITVCCTLPLGP